MIPLTVILLEFKSNKKQKILSVFLTNLFIVLKKPLVFAPILGMIYAFIGIDLPQVIVSSLKLIGNTTSGVSLFALGLIMSKFVIKFSKTTLLNIAIKNIVHPIFMMILVYLFGVTGIASKEVILLCAMPTATMTTMFALKYNTLPEESTSTPVLGTLFAIITLPIFMLLMGF